MGGLPFHRRYRSFGSGELNAIQRSNPEMQKRAANAIRGLVESDTIQLFLFTIMVQVDI
jgi:hypothetical protein